MNTEKMCSELIGVERNTHTHTYVYVYAKNINGAGTPRTDDKNRSGKNPKYSNNFSFYVKSLLAARLRNLKLYTRVRSNKIEMNST